MNKNTNFSSNSVKCCIVLLLICVKAFICEDNTTTTLAAPVYTTTTLAIPVYTTSAVGPTSTVITEIGTTSSDQTAKSTFSGLPAPNVPLSTSQQPITNLPSTETSIITTSTPTVPTSSVCHYCDIQLKYLFGERGESGILEGFDTNQTIPYNASCLVYLISWKLKTSSDNEVGSHRTFSDPNNPRVLTIPNLFPRCSYDIDIQCDNYTESLQRFTFTTGQPDLKNISCYPGSKDDEIHCTWDYPASNINYSLTTTTTMNNCIETNLTVNFTRSGTIKLTPGCNYTIQICPIHKCYSSSSNLINHCQNGNITVKPGECKVNDVKTTNDSLEFDYETPDGVFDSCCFHLSNLNSTCKESTDSNRTVKFTDLRPGFKYEIVVYAVSGNVRSENSSKIKYTKPNVPKVSCNNNTENTINLRVEDDDRYEYKIKKDNKQVKGMEKKSVHDGYIIVPGLKPYKQYSISVVSMISGSESDQSEEATVICWTDEDVPNLIQSCSGGLKNVHSSSSDASFELAYPFDEDSGKITKNELCLMKPSRDIVCNLVLDKKIATCSFFPFTLDKLEQDTKYFVFLRAHTGKGHKESDHCSIQTKPYSAALTVGLVIIVILLLLIAGVLLVLLYLRGQTKIRIPSLRALSNRRNQTELHPITYPSVANKPIKICDFLNYIQEMEKDSGLQFTEEFEELKYVGRNQLWDEAELQCNRPKNRFTNILPYDITRVKLLPIEDEEGSDYINANWISGFNSRREFIATQGPLPSTRDDFWRMVWENNCHAIVMLTNCVEKGRIKCDHYWPTDAEPMFYGDLQVCILNETLTEDWHMREFQLTLGESTRRLKHFHYIEWPDMYVPVANSLLAFVRLVRTKCNGIIDGGPIVVHCSAGVGRSGTLIALDTLLQQIEHKVDIDVFGVVYRMRMSRVLMVQTEQQFIFVYKCLKQVMEEMDEEEKPQNDSEDYTPCRASTQSEPEEYEKLRKEPVIEEVEDGQAVEVNEKADDEGIEDSETSNS